MYLFIQPNCMKIISVSKSWADAFPVCCLLLLGVMKQRDLQITPDLHCVIHSRWLWPAFSISVIDFFDMKQDFSGFSSTSILCSKDKIVTHAFCISCNLTVCSFLKGVLQMKIHCNVDSTESHRMLGVGRSKGHLVQAAARAGSLRNLC